MPWRSPLTARCSPGVTGSMDSWDMQITSEEGCVWMCEGRKIQVPHYNGFML